MSLDYQLTSLSAQSDNKGNAYVYGKYIYEEPH